LIEAKGGDAMTAPAEIVRLIETFERNKETYRQGGLNETQLRREFLDPFFKALGWDVDNTQGWAEPYKEVIHEDAIRIEASLKAPDYCFRIGGTRKFFVEAKAPSVNVKDATEPAYQVRRYAWSAKLPLSILTDFEEFAVYDCRVRPHKMDKASKARTKYLVYTEYVERWGEIAEIFSRDAVLKGSFDKYAGTEKRKHGTAEVDVAFLAEIESWREALAHNIALRNPKLSNRELNYAVQITIDRIIFLRICEDRGIERYGQLMALLNGHDAYGRLMGLFRKADDRYNSGLFHFQKEKARPEGPDELTPELVIDDKPLKDILRSLYYPDSPYEFSVLPAEILGQVYEQFLGKVITLTAGHHAKVEDKPEVKKAGGVFYTPAYIVDYIVKQTVGKLLEGRSVRFYKTKAPSLDRPLRVLDPACGSGSFLLGAYQLLLDWYRDYYVSHDPQMWAKAKVPPVYQCPRTGWRLTIAERKRILLDHIFGVDIDTQAVEVTKLSLLLRVLEGEKDLALFHNERALPDLSANIKCGNSLIAPDFYKDQQLMMFDEEERFRINAFDWHAEFPQVFQDNGFDAVIGNPPYGAYADEFEAKYLRMKYETPANSLDTFLLFVERAQQLLKVSGLLGMIIPSGWVSAPSAKPLRNLFLRSFQPISFVSLPFDVFHAYIDTVIITSRRISNQADVKDDSVTLVVFPARFRISGPGDFRQFTKTANYREWLGSRHIEFLITCSQAEARVLQRIRSQPSSFGELLLVKRGIEVFSPSPTGAGLVNPQRAMTGTLQRYDIEHGKPGFVSYAAEIQESKPFEFFSLPRILLRQVLSRKLRLQAAFTSEAFLTSQSVQSLVVNPSIKDAPALQYLLAILNSRLLSWYFVKFNSVARRDDFPKIIIQQTREMPLPKFDSKENNQCHDNMVELVEGMLRLHKALAGAKTPNEKETLQRQIAATDAQIDQLVYELYGLTPDEIRIVEGATQ
jgi:hypothetical protein